MVEATATKAILSSKKENYKCTKKNAKGSHDKLCTNAKSKPNASRRVLLGDSHVRWAAESNFLPEYFIGKGIGGLRSEQLDSMHRGIINFELHKVDGVIIHVGSNDISKGMKKDRVINNIDMTCRRLKAMNPNAEIKISAIFLQKYDTSRNLQIVQINAALEQHCLANGWYFIRQSNIAFKHLDKFGMHLTSEGNRIFSLNTSIQSQCG